RRMLTGKNDVSGYDHPERNRKRLSFTIYGPPHSLYSAGDSSCRHQPGRTLWTPGALIASPAFLPPGARWPVGCSPVRSGGARSDEMRNGIMADVAVILIDAGLSHSQTGDEPWCPSSSAPPSHWRAPSRQGIPA